ncbi:MULTISPECIES: RNA 2'-phosphotransferase [unclassified Pseudomonas]|uniref:RNA 2'-phosphotransferase n=1 Tax=unclassified Pseudomonas TaxID=196821 RepID=UPI002114911A|nr:MULTISPECIES: RNA 2'-phosphotransferase [unclassified Pseudomonas]
MLPQKTDLIIDQPQTFDKKRFSFSDDGLRIRAVQGHSTGTVSLQYVEKEPPELLYHGTATRFLESIREKGLTPGPRHHVHLLQDMQTAITVGQRYGKPVVLKVDALRMHQQGFRFFQAENGVWLTDRHAPRKALARDRINFSSPCPRLLFGKVPSLIQETKV